MFCHLILSLIKHKLTLSLAPVCICFHAFSSFGNISETLKQVWLLLTPPDPELLHLQLTISLGLENIANALLEVTECLLGTHLHVLYCKFIIIFLGFVLEQITRFADEDGDNFEARLDTRKRVVPLPLSVESFDLMVAGIARLQELPDFFWDEFVVHFLSFVLMEICVVYFFLESFHFACTLKIWALSVDNVFIGDFSWIVSLDVIPLSWGTLAVLSIRVEAVLFVLLKPWFADNVGRWADLSPLSVWLLL